MVRSRVNLVIGETRHEWMRLRTLVVLRWFAIAGQIIAVFVATRYLGFDLRLDLIATAIGASVAFNIIALLIFPENRRLSERAALNTLLFDLTQLAVLLFLCGGLSNPFSMLLIAPVVIAASALNLRATMIIGFAAVVFITTLVWLFLPLKLLGGSVLTLPPIFVYGMWAALLISIFFLGAYAYRVTDETFSMSRALTATQMALDREQRLTSLGGVVAAAAHELGTPLATIKLVSTELLDDLPDHSELREDIALINSQTDRCRDILHNMGRAGKDDTYLHNAPVSAVIQEAAAPHIERGKNIIIRVEGILLENQHIDQPEIPRLPEIIHGLRNLVQNAVDFADENVWVDISWDNDFIRLHIGDDGPGYPADLIGRIGDPFMRKRGHNRSSDNRPGYEGMGLGLFIAKTLLERCGAELNFANGSEYRSRSAKEKISHPDFARPTGAIVEVTCPRHTFETPISDVRSPLGENPINPDN